MDCVLQAKLIVNMMDVTARKDPPNGLSGLCYFADAMR